jgi:hypothetical protein
MFVKKGCGLKKPFAFIPTSIYLHLTDEHRLVQTKMYPGIIWENRTEPGCLSALTLFKDNLGGM